MDNWLKNPWIWAGGAAALVALWWLSSSSGGSSSGTASYAQANLDLVAQQSQISGAIEEAQISANTTNTANIAAAIGNLISANYAYKLGSQQVAAGVQTAQIGADTAKYIENDQVKINARSVNGAVRTAALADNAQYGTALVQANTAENIAGIQASTVKNAQTLGFIGNFLNSIGL